MNLETLAWASAHELTINRYINVRERGGDHEEALKASWGTFSAFTSQAQVPAVLAEAWRHALAAELDDWGKRWAS